jgi:hypothetical protein
MKRKSKNKVNQNNRKKKLINLRKRNGRDQLEKKPSQINRKKERSDKEIKQGKWYLAIVVKDGSGKIKNKLYNREFRNYRDVMYFITINKRNGKLGYYPIKGEEAIEFGFTFFKNEQLIRRIDRMFYYKYPEDRDNKQARKSFRTKARRWYRDYKKRLDNLTDFQRYPKRDEKE